MANSDLAKALGAYKIVEKSERSLILQYSQSMNRSVYIFTAVCLGIALFLFIQNPSGQLPVIANMVLAGVFILICSVLRYASITNPFIIEANSSQLKLRYKNFLFGEKELLYNCADLAGVEPYFMVTKYKVVAAVSFHLADKKEKQLFFAGSEKPLAIQNSEIIASLFAQVIGIKIIK